MKCRTAGTALVCAATLLLVACGGGGGSSAGAVDGNSGGATPPPAPPPPPPSGTAEGLWTGTTSNGRAAVGLVLDDGTYWVLYSLVGNSSQVAGVVQGKGSSQNGSFSSSDGKDFNFEGAGVIGITFSASYVAKRSLSATIRYPGATVSLPATFSNDYELIPSLGTIAGSYSGYAVSSGGAEAATATVSASGAVTGRSASGCTFSGSTAPRSKGNVYNLSVTFSGAPCTNGTATVTGIGFWDAQGGTLFSAALNSARSDGFLFVASKTANDPSGSIISSAEQIIFANEKNAFETDARAIINAGGAGGNTIRNLKENILLHSQRSFDQLVSDIISLSSQQGLRRATIIPIVTRLGDDWIAYMNPYMDDMLPRLGATPSLVASTKTELAAGMAQQRDSSISTLDSRIVWVY